MQTSRRAFLGLMTGALSACVGVKQDKAPATGGPAAVNRLITKYSNTYDVPESLFHRVVKRESGYNPQARNGRYMGLMQIDPRTAEAMGYNGAPDGLLDAETNLIYGGKYLRGAWLVSGGNQDAAISWYSKGYYYQAKRLGILSEVGLA